MIQDISPHIYHNEYKNLSPKDHDFILIFQGNTVLVRFQDDKLRYPTFSEVRNFSLGYHYLFSIDEYQYFLAYALSSVCSAVRFPGILLLQGLPHIIFSTGISPISSAAAAAIP